MLAVIIAGSLWDPRYLRSHKGGVLGYSKHEAAIVESEHIGNNTRIEAFAHILAGATIGEDCTVSDHVFIENDVRVGNRVTIGSFVQVCDGVTLEDDVIVGANAAFTNERFPQNERGQGAVPRTVIQAGASIGTHATLLPGITVGAGAMVGAGAVVTRDVPRNSLVTGNPARIRGYTHAADIIAPETVVVDNLDAMVSRLKVRGVQFIKLPKHTDLRGSLTVTEFDTHLPFKPMRHFLVYNVPGKDVRGEHAHRTLHQFLVCINGSCNILVDDGQARNEIMLDNPTLGIHVQPMVWCVQYKFTPDAVLSVLASHHYDPKDYIRSYDEFLDLLKGRE